ncbi:MAG: hypothetical protein WBM08_09885 [Prochlorococcaceae cyanobacterium]
MERAAEKSPEKICVAGPKRGELAGPKRGCGGFTEASATVPAYRIG